MLKILKKWEVNLNHLDENLGEEKRDAGISTTLTSLYISLEVGAIVPLKFLPTSLRGLYAIIGVFGAVIIGIAANAVGGPYSPLQSNIRPCDNRR